MRTKILIWYDPSTNHEVAIIIPDDDSQIQVHLDNPPTTQNGTAIGFVALFSDMQVKGWKQLIANHTGKAVPIKMNGSPGNIMPEAVSV